MKKKLSVLILSCFLLSTPCFAFDKHHPKHKPMPPKIHHNIDHKHSHCCNHKDNYYENYSYTTEEDVQIAKIQGLTDIVISILTN